MQAQSVDEVIAAGLAHHRAGRLQEAERLYRTVLQAQPQHAGAMHLLGVIAHQAGQHEQAVQLIRHAIKLNATDPAYFSNLGEALRAMGRFDEAEPAYRQAIALNHEFTDAHYNLGNLLMAVDRHDEAATCYQTAIDQNPQHFLAWMNRGLVLQQQGKLTESIDAMKRSVQINQRYAPGYLNLGKAMLDLGDPVQAEKLFRQAVEVDARFAEGWSNLGHALLALCRVDEAIEATRKAISLRPNFAEAHSNLLLMLHYRPESRPDELADAHHAWAERHVAGVQSMPARPIGPKDRDRKLRVGYLSADMRNHAMSGFISPLLSQRDRERFEAVCYADVAAPDHISQSLREHAEQWRAVHRLTDTQLAEQIRADRIDILVDLHGHTAGHRLGVFAQRPAPLQIAYGAYHDTTGLATIDYRLTDHQVEPDEPRAQHADRLYRLDSCCLCWNPIEPTPDVNTLPALERAAITFGSFNNSFKISEPNLAAWANILHALPAAKLCMLVGGEATAQAFVERFARHGIAADRVTYWGKRPRPAYLRLFHEVDLALDTFPYNGQTTTMETLWMGVPVVTCRGKSGVSRIGSSILCELGLDDWICDDLDDYAATALRWACDPSALSACREGLRDRLARSSICSGAGVRRIEATFRKMWTDLCDANEAH